MTDKKRSEDRIITDCLERIQGLEEDIRRLEDKLHRAATIDEREHVAVHFRDVHQEGDFAVAYQGGIAPWAFIKPGAAEIIGQYGTFQELQDAANDHDGIDAANMLAQRVSEKLNSTQTAWKILEPTFMEILAAAQPFCNRLEGKPHGYPATDCSIEVEIAALKAIEKVVKDGKVVMGIDL